MGPCSPRQLSAWLQAAGASLQLLPRLARLDSHLQQLGRRTDGVQLLGKTFVRAFVAILPPQLQQLSSSSGFSFAALGQQDAAAWASLPAQLWALHACLCRLTAALTAPSAPLRVSGMQLTADCWRSLQTNLSALLLRCVSALQPEQQHVSSRVERNLAEADRQVQPCGRSGCYQGGAIHLCVAISPLCWNFNSLNLGSSCRETLDQLHATCAAHVPAMQAAEAAEAHAAPGGAGPTPAREFTIVQAAAIVAAILPCAADPWLPALSQRVLSKVQEVRCLM